MKVKYLAHAAFKLTSSSGLSIVTDPYTAGDKIKFGDIRETADIVTISHEHYDHNNAAAVKGNPKVVKSSTGQAEIKGIKIQGIATFHDEASGSQRGKNVVYIMEIDGIRVCHLGDLGHGLTPGQVAELGKIDVLLLPVGGFYTIDAAGATRVCDAIAPRVVIPMHFKTPKIDLPIAPVDDFLKGKKNVTRIEGSETELDKSTLPKPTQIVVLKPAM